MKRKKKSETSVSAFLPYYIIIAIVLLGFLTGSFSAARFTGETAEEYLESIQSALNTNGSANAAFKAALARNINETLILWALGLAVFGSIPLFITAYCRGYTLGVTLTFLAVHYKFKGVIATVAGVLPHTLMYFPAFVLLTGCAVKFSHGLLKDRNKLKTKFLSYCISTAFVFAWLIIGSAVEGYISCGIFRSVINVK